MSVLIRLIADQATEGSFWEAILIAFAVMQSLFIWSLRFQELVLFLKACNGWYSTSHGHNHNNQGNNTKVVTKANVTVSNKTLPFTKPKEGDLCILPETFKNFKDDQC